MVEKKNEMVSGIIDQQPALAITRIPIGINRSIKHTDRCVDPSLQGDMMGPYKGFFWGSDSRDRRDEKRTGRLQSEVLLLPSVL